MAEAPRFFTGDIPRHYDEGLGPWIFADAASDLARRAAALAPASVLESAAGTGILSRRLRDALPASARLVVTDLSPAMLDVARTKFAADEAVDVAQADAMSLPFPGASFDLVVCQFGVMFFPDKVDAFREAARVLRPGGHLLFNSWASMRDNAFAQVAQAVSEQVFPEDPPGFYTYPFSYGDPAQALSDLSQAGLVARHAELCLRREVTDPEGFARGLVHGNPIIAELAERGIAPDAVVSAMREELEARLGTPPVLDLKAHVFTARKPEIARESA